MKSIKLASAATLALSLVALATPAFALDTTNTAGFQAPAAAGGDLTLDSAPNLNFGTTNLTTATTVTATPDAAVQVTDNRGTAVGWKVSVLPTNLTSGTTVLTGATIDFPAPTVLSNANGGSINPVQSPAAFQLNVGGSAALVDVADAAAGTGTGVNNLTYATATLNVPNGAAQALTYTGTLTWTLAVAP